MKDSGKILCLPLLVFLILFVITPLTAQQKFALVIGNGAYTTVSELNNPVNDANDMKAALEGLGFQVDLLLNGSLGQMEDAVIRLGRRLSGAPGSYGFLFYAGHGVQSNGENYLIPVDADIRSESLLRSKAMVVQFALDEIQLAENSLNVIVLDACRDNPFNWKARGGSRGLTVVGAQPPESIIVYATSAGSTASDGGGRNGLFTSHLLNNLKIPDLEVKELFNRVGRDVSQASNNAQRPAIYSQFFNNAYLGSLPASAVPAPPPSPQPAPAPRPAAVPVLPVAGEARGHIDKGKAALGLKDYDIAIAEYTEAIRITTNYAEAYFGRGNVYYSKRDYDRAITDYTEAIKINPNYANAYNNRGNVYYSKHDYDRAITDYTEAVRINPNYADAYNNRGIAYETGKRNYDRAIADYTEAIRINPNYVNAYNNRGDAYKAKGDQLRANADYTTARRLAP
jgi:Flp pilus assembly protein TadD